MKENTPTKRLRKYCFIEIYREGKYVGKGIYICRAGLNPDGKKQSRIHNERDMIEYIPTDQIKRIGVETSYP